MKVLILDGAGFSPPYDMALAKGLESQGATVKLVMPDAVRDEWCNPDGLPMPAPSGFGRIAQRTSKAIGYGVMLRALVKSVREWKPDVVHVQWLPLPLLDLRFLRALQSSVPLVHTMHNTSLFHGSSGGLQGWGLRDALACFDRVVVHSEYSRGSAIELGLVPEDRLRVIPHGAFDYYKAYGSRSPRAASPVQLLFAGSIKRYKGLDLLVDALPMLAASAPAGSWHLTIAGHPGMPVESLRNAVAKRGLDAHVSWSLRHQSERELGQLLTASHVVVLPYREIDQSGVLLAAIGVERPVVATRVGAFPELLQDEQHGLLVPPDDRQALGAALARLVVDGPFRTYCETQMSSLASDSLNWSAIGRSTLDMYRELTAS